jgi:hypothetical protein
MTPFNPYKLDVRNFTIMQTSLQNVEKTANYDKQAISISYEGDGLPAFGFLNGTVQELDEIPSTIMLNKTKATLNCSSGSS